MPQQMTILGAGPALPDAERDNCSMVWESPAGHLLIDCGGRCYQQLLRARIDPLKLRAVLLTHSHVDHIYGLPALLFHLWLANYRGTLDVYANPSTLEMVQSMCSAMHLPQNGHMCDVTWHTLAETPESPVFATDHYTLMTTPADHSVPTLALQIMDLETKRKLVYSADTKPTTAIEHMAVGAHTLIHEATESDPDAGHGHSTPYQAGEIARRANVDQLILIHYSSQYTMPEPKALAEVRKAGFEGRVEIAQEMAHYLA